MSYVPWVIKSLAKFINNKKKVSTDRASMILRKCFAIIVLDLSTLARFVYFIICNSYSLNMRSAKENQTIKIIHN